MTLLDIYHSKDQDRICITPEQASAFAKDVAGDFNPIHDPDAKRFCVPGDLLFALVLDRQGVSQQMHFQFKGLMGKGIQPHFKQTTPAELSIVDDNDKIYLTVESEGENSKDPDLVRKLTCNYVTFSGQNFPHLLIPLMEQHNVMINPQRPLVIYESMYIHLDSLDVTDPELEFDSTSLEVNGKRGNVCLRFCIKTSGNIIGKGEKNLVLSGLRPYVKEAMERVVDNYTANKQAYTNND